ncbi:MAG: helix-turn-helix domain-containing protein [Micromonosporaceae bacterium]|nr:helix-turn-helix domain-containing protein [Micromonosporaceae bacterium]
MGDRTWQLVAALADPVRRSLYELVRRQGRPVTREEAAQAIDISRNLAAFHLDKLVDLGMLRARYEAPTQRPRGRGRTPKVYEATGDGLTLTVPPRQYELLATILAGAVEAADATATARQQAAAYGHAVGQNAPHQEGCSVDRAVRALAELGYEPRPESGGIALDNCPFHPLANLHTDLVCGLNVDFIAGLLSGLGCADLRAELAPRPGACCVEVRPRS